MQFDKRIYSNNIQLELRRKSSRLIQEIHGMGAQALLQENDEDLCARLVLKYQNTVLADDPKTQDDSSFSNDALTQTLLETIARRKANFFSRRKDRREIPAKRKSA